MAITGLGMVRICLCTSKMVKRGTPTSPMYPPWPRTFWSSPEQKASGPCPVRNDADLGILTANFERIVQFDDSLRTKGIAHFGPVDGDLGDALFHALKKKILICFYRDPCFHLISSRVELIGLRLSTLPMVARVKIHSVANTGSRYEVVRARGASGRDGGR